MLSLWVSVPVVFCHTLGTKQIGLKHHVRPKAEVQELHSSSSVLWSGIHTLLPSPVIYEREGFSSSSTPDSSFSVFKAIHSLTSLKSCWCLRLQGSSLELDPPDEGGHKTIIISFGSQSLKTVGRHRKRLNPLIPQRFKRTIEQGREGVNLTSISRGGILLIEPYYVSVPAENPQSRIKEAQSYLSGS